MKSLVKSFIISAFLVLPLSLTADSTRSLIKEKLSSGDWIQQAEVLKYAARHKVVEAVPQIKKIIVSKEKPWVRGEAFKALVKILPEEAGSLAKAYMKDPNEPVKVAVAQICADLSTETAAPILKELLKNKGQVHYHALASYAKHRGEKGWKFSAPSLKKIPDDSLAPAVRALGFIANDEALTILKSLIKDSKTPQRILQGLQGIKKEQLMPLYFDLFNNPNLKKPINDLFLTLKVYDREFLLKEFHKILSSGNVKNINLVAQLMSYGFKDEKLLENLHKALQKTDDAQTLISGLTALSGVKPDTYKDLFNKHLKHQKNEVRIVAINCLGQCESVNLFETMQGTLQDKDSKVRIAALLSLNKASPEEAPKNLGEYFNASILAKDKVERRTAVSVVIHYINRENSETVLPVLYELLVQHEREEALILARPLFRLIPVEKSKQLLKKLGFVTDWHVVGAFPSGPAVPVEKEIGIDVPFPPENKVDVNEKYLVKYNSRRARGRRGDDIEKEISWVKAVVDNEDGILYMAKAGRSQLTLPARKGVAYAYTEISVSQKTSATLKMFVEVAAKQKVWINGKLLSFKFNLSRNQKLVTKTSEVSLQSGMNKILVKVESSDDGWIRDLPSKRYFNFTLLDSKGKVVKWSQP